MIKKNSSPNLASVVQASQLECAESDLLSLPSLPNREFTVNLSPVRTTKFLFLVVLMLTIANIIGQFSFYFLPYYPLRNVFRQIFDVGGEGNIPALYSVFLLLFSGIILGIIADVKKAAHSPYTRYWQILAAIFVFLSIDEAISIHERVGNPLRNTLNVGGFFYFAWVIPASILVVIFLLGFFRFILALPTNTRALFLLAGGIYIAGTLGMESVSGYYAHLQGEDNIVYAGLTAIEELLEMGGIVIFIYGLLSYLKLYLPEVRCRFNLIEDKPKTANPNL